MKKTWTDFYNNEQELIDDMMLTYTNDMTSEFWKVCKGYVYLNSFKHYYTQKGYLTEKQMTQLKRLAPEVYKNVHEVLKIK